LTNSEKERNNDLVAYNAMTKKQLKTAKDLNKNLQENLDKLKESNLNLSKLVTSSNDEIIRTNKDNKILFENKKIHDL
jgi:esterase/lipase